MQNHFYETWNSQLYIDKTSSLEKGIVVFPSIYIEGSAATGKTTAVKMLLSNHPEVLSYCYSMMQYLKETDCTRLEDGLQVLLKRMETEKIWVVFEDINEYLPKDICLILKNFVRNMPESGRVIFVGRFCQSEFLDLLWKREMELIGQTELMFTRNNIREYLNRNKVYLNAADVYNITGGWAGCVDMMVRFADRSNDVKELRNLYEIDTYIEREIIEKLDSEEKEIIELGRICPWLDEKLCKSVWFMEDAAEILKQLTRKGIFQYNHVKQNYILPILFQKETEPVSKEKWLNLAKWYEKRNYLKEAYQCINKSKDEKAYRKFMFRHYNRIPFLDVRYDEVMNWYELRPEICYLRGYYSYAHQYFDNLKKEIERVSQWNPSTEEEFHKKTEIYLNLLYLNPEITLQEWMQHLESLIEQKGSYHLYSMLGTGYSFLCGIRDISGLFACEKKEEKGLQSYGKMF